MHSLPPELLVQVLSYVPPGALVTYCRLVCHATGPQCDCCSWLVTATLKAIDSIRWSSTAHPIARPLLLTVSTLRPGALLPASAPRPQPHLQLLRGRQRLKGGTRWEWLVRGKEPNSGAGGSSQTCFVTSFEWCFKRQLVDLVMEGVWQELLDSAQVEICVADCHPDLGTFALCSYPEHLPPDPHLALSLPSGLPRLHRLCKGIGYVSFEYGRDTQCSWVGHCGTLVTHSSVRVRIPLSLSRPSRTYYRPPDIIANHQQLCSRSQRMPRERWGPCGLFPAGFLQTPLAALAW
ncbi:F-box only protein 17 [Artibeus jamaicensis]|uniref:F-box only protein 17 n=1 Tax=Artibeus jamaicensis TaxID=9417 RepID=UPI00235A660F|nr:F-box only protein 17 [Artibeus jamaicensis]